MLHRLVAAVLMLVASAGFGFAETVPSPPPNPDSCVPTLDGTRARLAGLAARGAVAILTDIEGEMARTWIARFNAVPPRTEHEGDTVLAIVTIWSPNVLVAIFQDGCEVTRGTLGPAVYRAIETAVANEGGKEVEMPDPDRRRAWNVSDQPKYAPHDLDTQTGLRALSAE